MKTTIDIPEKLLQEAIKHTGAKTKRDAIVTAMDAFNRQRRLEEMAERLQGSCPHFMTHETLKQTRLDDRWKALK